MCVAASSWWLELTIDKGNGVIQDISPPAERGSFIAFYQASRFQLRPTSRSCLTTLSAKTVRNFSIAVGPVLGGVLSEFLGFRAVFGFLLLLSSLVLVVIVLFLPETLDLLSSSDAVVLHEEADDGEGGADWESTV